MVKEDGDGGEKMKEVTQKCFKCGGPLEVILDKKGEPRRYYGGKARVLFCPKCKITQPE